MRKIGKQNEMTKFRNGDVYSFETFPFNHYSHQSTGRYACLKIVFPVICFDKEVPNSVGFIVLDRVFTQPPSIAELNEARPLIQRRFKFGEKTPFQRMSKKEPKPNYAVSSTPMSWENELLKFTHIGHIPLTQKEEEIGADIRSTSSWRFASSTAEGEWRWANDKEALLRETGQAKAKKLEQERIAKERYDTRLVHLTWEQIENEVYFKRWKSSPPFPPQAFTSEIRLIIKLAILELKDLGSKPKKGLVRKCLKKSVSQITSLNAQHGFVIETEERQDIYEVFFDLTHLSKQPTLIDEIEDWHYKDW